MRKILFSILFGLCAAQLFAQGKATVLANIRREFRAINSDSSLKKVVLNNEEFLGNNADGGGQLTGFYIAGQLRKMVRSVGLSNGNEVFEFYFKDRELIFVLEMFNSFAYDEKKQAFLYDKTERTFEGRYYFAHRSLIDQSTTGHNRFEDDALDPQKILLQEAAENEHILARKRKKQY